MMGGETPTFWWREPGWQARALSPFGTIYGAVARRRLDRGERAEAGVPVLCVGNFTIGGGGKTPTALTLGEAARAVGLTPGFLSRGYGGSVPRAVLVDRAHHGARMVGDEPLLLAECAPTAVARDRKAGAALLRQAGCDLIIMDDGFQSARLAVDFALVVIDSGRGLGNGRVIPAGPLRAPLTDQIRHADALVVVGRGSAGDAAIRRTAKGGKPIFEAALRPRAFARPERPLLAYAGIADPEKFYRTLREMDLDIGATRDFPDHHRLSADEIGELLDRSERERLQLVTTRKDAVRLEESGAGARELLARSLIVEVDLVFEPENLGVRFVRETVTAFKQRRLR